VRHLRLIAAALVVAACGGGDDDDAADPDGSPGNVDASPPDGGGVLPEGPGLAGVLYDGDGVILRNEDVLACMETVCLYGDSGLEGSFAFEIKPPALVALKTQEDVNSQPRRGSALCPVAITGDELVEVGPLHCPSLPDGEPFGPVADDPQTLAPGDGLELTLRRADLTPRVGDVLVDAAARLMPPAKVCSLLTVPGEEIVAVYALHPFGAVSSSPIGVRVPVDLPAGTAVNFRSISEIDGVLSAAAAGMSDGEFAATDAGQGITELSWLVVSH
jgi:hypothetical protein